MRSNLAENINLESDRSSGKTLYDRLGGRECLDRVHKRLYDRLFTHPTLGVFFVGKDQQYQESQQSDFMAAEFGGPRDYRGRLPDGAHQHMFITEEHFDLRLGILAETLAACVVEPELREQWLAVDRRFKNLIVKKTVGDCTKRYGTDHIIVAPGP